MCRACVSVVCVCVCVCKGEGGGGEQQAHARKGGQGLIDWPGVSVLTGPRVAPRRDRGGGPLCALACVRA